MRWMVLPFCTSSWSSNDWSKVSGKASADWLSRACSAAASSSGRVTAGRVGVGLNSTQPSPAK